MKCQFCSKPKVYEVTEIQGGEVKSVYLCETCFQAYITNSSTALEKIEMPVLPDPHLVAYDPQTANKFVKDIMEFVETLISQIPSKEHDEKKCPVCGLTLHDLMKTGKLGCANCYEYYKNELVHVLQLSHKTPNNESLVHKGKTPKNRPAKTQENLEPVIEETNKMLLTKLEYKLAIAVKQENYEQAAKLRDIIKELKSKMLPNQESDKDQ